MEKLKASDTGLILVDLQNDFLHPEGAYGRAGQSCEAIQALPDKVRPLADALRSKGGWVISTQFTLVPGRGGEPIIDPHLKKLRPFLKRGDFCPGTFGHQLVQALQPADFYVEKVAYSAFYQSRLDYVLARAGIRNLIFAGIVTNGGVASTARDAHTRGYRAIILSDATAAFQETVHDITIQALAAVMEVADGAKVLAALEE